MASRSRPLTAIEDRTASLRGITGELRTLNNIMSSIWSLLSPTGEYYCGQSLSDEYISIEETAKRLSIKPELIREWILEGIRNPKKGWHQGVHYIVLDYADKESTDNPEIFFKRYGQLIRIPWNYTIKYITMFEQKERKVQVIDLMPESRKMAKAIQEYTVFREANGDIKAAKAKKK